ncbi:B12-binding domain-containing radical SAM protein [Desulfonatronum sp. SC1]|uniref:B12-binding domain-containing radical SAM protein n=1 Tax=Desulfonatronum sp. SC1 TaxID=2109626 RepID=UPI001E52D906|nr:B12-binding domain-containing radical SAM protein [Desulfonatronum sp. SC1]
MTLDSQTSPINVLLIYPEIPDTFWSFKHALKFVGKKVSSPPLGLVTIAAMLPKHWNPRLVDLNIRELSLDDLLWAEYALVSAMTVQRESSRKAIRLCKDAGLLVVAGGPLFTVEHEHFPEVDHFVLNEAELTLPEFLLDLSLGRAKRVYATDRFADIGQTPVPRWDLLELKQYASMSVQYSRGCPFSCDFCNVTALLGRTPRNKNAPQMIAELDSLYANGWRGGIFFVDDNLIGNKRRLKAELLPALVNWRKGKKGMPFGTEASINLADDEELLAMMVEAGFDTVFIGIETPNEASLSECGKGQNICRDLIRDVKRIQRFGIQVQGGFIVGFDNDEPTIFNRLVEFIQQSGITTAMVGLLQAPPGTRLYSRLKQAGRLREGISGDNVDGTTNILPTMTLESLRDGYKEILKNIYSPEAYYARVITFLREYKLPVNKKPWQIRRFSESLMALFRSIFRLGILGQERFHYWKLFFWTLLRRPRSLPLAVTLAIYGYHFRRVCELRVL